MKKTLIAIAIMGYLGAWSVLLSNAFAWETYNEKTAIHSDYNKQESNPKNYHRDDGAGLTRVD